MEPEPRMQWVPDEYEDKEYEGGAIVTLSALLLLLWFIFTNVWLSPVVLALLAVATVFVLPLVGEMILDASLFLGGRVAKVSMKSTASRDEVERAVRLLASRMPGHRMRRSIRQLYRLSELDVRLSGEELRETVNVVIQGGPRVLWIRVGPEATSMVPILEGALSGLVELPLVMPSSEGATFKAQERCRKREAGQHGLEQGAV